MKDVLLYKTKALPAAAATATSDTIDLGPQGGAHRGREMQILIEVPATPSLVDTKLITLGITDSADDNSFTAVPGYGGMTIAGVATSQGGPATTFKLKIHDHVRRYLRFTAAVESGGGSNIAVSVTYSIVYP